MPTRPFPTGRSRGAAAWRSRGTWRNTRKRLPASACSTLRPVPGCVRSPRCAPARPRPRPWTSIRSPSRRSASTRAPTARAIDVTRDDLLDDEPPDVDVILAGDCWYEERFATRISAWLARAASGRHPRPDRRSRPPLPRARRPDCASDLRSPIYDRPGGHGPHDGHGLRAGQARLVVGGGVRDLAQAAEPDLVALRHEALDGLERCASGPGAPRR